MLRTCYGLAIGVMDFGYYSILEINRSAKPNFGSDREADLSGELGNTRMSVTTES